MTPAEAVAELGRIAGEALDNWCRGASASLLSHQAIVAAILAHPETVVAALGAEQAGWLPFNYRDTVAQDGYVDLVADEEEATGYTTDDEAAVPAFVLPAGVPLPEHEGTGQ